MTSANGMTRDGLTIGLIAYASVAAFYSAFDLLAARGALYTVNLLGRTLFRGLRDPAVLQHPTQLDYGAIVWYNGLHLLASLAIGLVVLRLVQEAERRPHRAAAMLAGIVLGFLVTIAVVGWLSAPLRVVLPWWSIVVANTIAVMLAAAYMLWRRPGIWSRLVPFGLGGSKEIFRVTGAVVVAGALATAACAGPAPDGGEGSAPGVVGLQHSWRARPSRRSSGRIDPAASATDMLRRTHQVDHLAGLGQSNLSPSSRSTRSTGSAWDGLSRGQTP